MDNNGTPIGGAPLMENEYVKELFAIMQDNGKDTSGLAAIIGHVGEMENFVKRAENKLADMKSQLAEMKEVQNHPIKAYLQNAIKRLENTISHMKEQITATKTAIIDGCKSAVAAFKEKGASVLNNLAQFFGIKKGLQDWSKEIDGIIKADDRAVAKINAFASEYHTAGLAVKNMAHVVVGRQPIDDKKEAGKLAKALAAPYKAQKSAVTGLKKALEKAIVRLDALDGKVAERQAQRAAEKKPSLLKRLEENNARAERTKLERPTPERTKVAVAEV